MNFVTDLYESRQHHVKENVIWEPDSDPAENPALEFGFGGLGSNMDSEFDSDEFEVNPAFINYGEDIYDIPRVSNNNYHTTENEREGFEWEEVSERIHYDERENLDLVTNQIEEISVTSDSSLGAEEERAEWEVLLAVNNLERESEFPNTDLREDYILTMEFDAFSGQLYENENASMGSRPAAKSMVENLPSTVITKEEVAESNNVVICAVCKDEFAIGLKVIRMPCCHPYHGECILPWLNIRNTCPVCRYELPTEYDADYERRGTLADDFEVSLEYNVG